ncbi:MAG: hypothetical protein H6721_14265 [Sandaracinus sp.]|nr:hypothetical protein [Myxococcales bacterium]MCB9633280.1 hypothetical protein [Sandaracinus sp.]
MTRVTLLLVALGFATACATAPATPPLAPSTENDPEPWVAAPRTEGVAGRAVSLTLAGGRDEARSVALRFLRALRDADEATLSQLFDDPVAQMQPRPNPPILRRTQLLEHALRNPRRNDLRPDMALEEFVSVEGMEVTPLRESLRDVPSGLRGTDLLVTIPFEARGRAIMRFFVPGWHQRGSLLLRSTSTGWRVVGV